MFGLFVCLLPCLLVCSFVLLLFHAVASVAAVLALFPPWDVVVCLAPVSIIVAVVLDAVVVNVVVLADSK